MGNGKKRRVIRRAPSVYYSPKAVRKSEVRIDWRLLWLGVRLLLPVVIVVYIFWLSPIFKIKEVIVSGNEHVDKSQIEAMIPKGLNIFMLNQGSLEKKITGEITDIESVKIYKGIPSAVKIVIVEHGGSLVWQSGISYYLVSSKGVAFRDITTEIGNYTELPKVVDRRNLAMSVPVQAVSANFIDFVNKIFGELKTQTNLEPDYFAVDETTVDLFLYTKAGIYAKFDSLRNADKQLQDLKLVLLEKRPEIKEYIDLRVNGWAYYK